MLSSPTTSVHRHRVKTLRAAILRPVRRKLKRYYGNGDLHFITCSCHQREPLLGTSQRRDLFLSVLEGMRIHYQFVVAGYVIMPEHIHLLPLEIPRTM